MRLIPLLLLCSCLGQPDTSDLCFENRLRVWNVCEVETTPDDEDRAFESCQRDAGFAVALGCGHELRALLECSRDAAEGADCEGIAFSENEQCAFEQGIAAGCLSRQ